MNKPTPILDELRITIEGAVALFDAEPDEDHPDPIDDAIELVREAEELLPEVIKSAVVIPEAGDYRDRKRHENNIYRANLAIRAVDRFAQETNTDDEDALCDLLCNLLHYANCYEINFATELRKACNHFAAETSEP